MDSKKGRFWTVPRAEAAIQAVFVAKGVLRPANLGELRLRFSEIKAAVSAMEGQIGDRTLSRSLTSLVKSGRLHRSEDGRKAVYWIVLTRMDRVAALARAEAASVTAAGGVGGWGDGEAGWATFGVPEGIPKRYRAKLRRACLAHQEALQEILGEVWDECLEAMLEPTRRRVPRKLHRAGEAALQELTGYQVLGARGLSYSARLWGVIEQATPGALEIYRKDTFPGMGPDTPFSEITTAVVAKLGGTSVAAVRPQVEKELAKVQGDVAKLVETTDPLWKALKPSERARLARRFALATSLTIGLTSVVHA